MNDWTDCKNELPSNDGFYQVKFLIDENIPMNVGLAEYDGYGFKLNEAYRPVNYWKNLEKREKKYGKQLIDESLDNNSKTM